VFALWWIYFDGVHATAHRLVRSMADAKRFQLWSYVHLPLYLGIAVIGVGLERVIEKATEAPLSAPEALILAGAVATVAISLVAIRRSTSRERAFEPM
jgi:low temperature requirement protein LtrA